MAFYSFYTPEAFAATTVSADEVLKRLKEGNVWVAVKDEHIMGTVAVVKQGNDLYIRGMACIAGSKRIANWLEIFRAYSAVRNGEQFQKFVSKHHTLSSISHSSL